MKTKLFFGIIIGAFLMASLAVASEPANDGDQLKVKKQEKLQKQEKKQIKSQDQLKAQEQKRNRHRHRNRNQSGNQTGSSNESGDSPSSGTAIDPNDDTQFVDNNGDGINDQVQESKGKQGERKMKRGQHRNRHRGALGSGQQKGLTGQGIGGKGFGKGFVDINNNGICDKFEGKK
ncbi:MAG: hypothetical protein JRJ87_27265 [Deltaproteobacteria bacterium]|nr:hypothetical protein [Deltaproteobacteria bacterium]